MREWLTSTSMAMSLLLHKRRTASLGVADLGRMAPMSTCPRSKVSLGMNPEAVQVITGPLLLKVTLTGSF